MDEIKRLVDELRAKYLEVCEKHGGCYNSIDHTCPMVEPLCEDCQGYYIDELYNWLHEWEVADEN